MASEVYTIEEVELQDGTVVEIRPLPIAKLRKFMRVWNAHMKDISTKINDNMQAAQKAALEAEMAEEGVEPTAPELPHDEADMTDQQYDTYVTLCTFGLSSTLQGEKTDKAFKNYLEDNLDEPTIYKILDVTGGLKLNEAESPNQNPAVT